MALKASEISAVIKSQIEAYGSKIKTQEVGKVITVGDGIALVSGLDNAMLGELLEFPGKVLGMALNLEEEAIGVVLMGSDEHIREGDTVKRTKRVISVPVGNQMLGRVVDALGQPIDGKKSISNKITKEVFKIAPGVMTREEVNQTLETGLLAIDSMIPIGKGQRELIIGDRQTGKTAIAIDAIINQKGKNVNCIYVAIGQKNSTVAQIVQKLNKAGAMEYTTIVSASASEKAPLQYIAPYSGVTIAEEWMSQGKDVLIVYDDLSKHAVAYRTLSLLLRRPPGREAYPGDVFYLHSQLLERAARINASHGGGSITALPIIETQAGDISAYIPTNVISITDGQIFTRSNLFNSGQRPAVDAGFSVSRVGSTAQFKMMKNVSGSLKLELAQYHEMAAFAQFGSDLDESTRRILNHGSKVMQVLKQHQYAPMSQVSQTIILFAVKHRLINPVPIANMSSYKNDLRAFFHNDKAARKLRLILIDNPVLDDFMVANLKWAIAQFTNKFVNSIEGWTAKANDPMPKIEKPGGKLKSTSQKEKVEKQVKTKKSKPSKKATPKKVIAKKKEVKVSHVEKDMSKKQQFHISFNNKTEMWDIKQVGAQGKVLSSYATQKEAHDTLGKDFKSRPDGDGGHIFVHEKSGLMLLEHSINIGKIESKEHLKEINKKLSTEKSNDKTTSKKETKKGDKLASNKKTAPKKSMSKKTDEKNKSKKETKHLKTKHITTFGGKWVIQDLGTKGFYGKFKNQQEAIAFALKSKDNYQVQIETENGEIDVIWSHNGAHTAKKAPAKPSTKKTAKEMSKPVVKKATPKKTKAKTKT